MNVPQFIYPTMVDRHLDYFQFGAMVNNTAVNKHSFLLDKHTKVMLLGHPSSSVFPHCSGVLIHAGAGHALGFLPTCRKSPSLPGHTFRTDFYLVSLKHLVTILSFLNILFSPCWLTKPSLIHLWICGPPWIPSRCLFTVPRSRIFSILWCLKHISPLQPSPYSLRSSVPRCHCTSRKDHMCDSLLPHELLPGASSVHGDSPGKNTGAVTMPSSRNLPNTRIKCTSPALQADSLLSELPGKPWRTIYSRI